MAKVLTPQAVMEIHRMREELNEWEEPKYSGAHIAEQLGVSEATIWRVLKKRAAYSTGKAGNGQVAARFDAMSRDTLGAMQQNRPELDAAAAASEARMLARLSEVKAVKELPLSDAAKERLALFTEVTRSPLDE